VVVFEVGVELIWVEVVCLLDGGIVVVLDDVMLVWVVFECGELLFLVVLGWLFG